MRKFFRYLFHMLVLVLWLTALAVGLEVWERWRLYAVETRNPFVLSRTQGQEWPIPDAQSNAFAEWLQDLELRARYRGAGKSEAPRPPIDYRWEMKNRLILFRDLDDWGRQVFANVYGLQILLMGRDDMVTRMFPVQDFADKTPLTEVLPAEEAAWVRNGAQLVMGNLNPTGSFIPSDIVFVPASDGATEGVHEEHKYCIVAEPIPDFNQTRYFNPAGEWMRPVSPDDSSRYPGSVWVFYRIPDTEGTATSNLGSGNVSKTRLNQATDVMDAATAHDLWDVPYFLYRKHVRRKDHVNVLGLAEDFYSNNHGFRDWDFPVEKGEGVFRIICVGASTTEEGPTNDLTYPAILEAMLNRHFETNRFEVINCGISGMNSLKHRMRSEDYLALDPDLIIIYNAVNDICHDLFPIWVKDASPRRQLLRKSQFVNTYFNRHLLPGALEMKSDILRTKMNDLRFFAKRAKERGIAVALCSFAAPDPSVGIRLSSAERDYYDYCTRKEWGGRYVTLDSYLRALLAYNLALRTLCNDEELLYIPVSLRGGAELFGDICHLRNPGIEAKAQIIADFLIENELVK